MADIEPIRATGFNVFSTGVTFESYVRWYDPIGFNTVVHAAGALVRPARFGAVRIKRQLEIA